MQKSQTSHNERQGNDELATTRTLQTGVSVWHHQEVIRHADGTALPVLVNAVALDARVLDWTSAEDGQSTGREPLAIVVHQDVTAFCTASQQTCCLVKAGRESATGVHRPTHNYY